MTMNKCKHMCYIIKIYIYIKNICVILTNRGFGGHDSE